MIITFTDIPSGFFKASVSEIKEKNGPYGHYLLLTFTVSEGILKSYKFSGPIKPLSLRQGKFYRWVKNILGYEPDDNFSTDDLIGKPCFILLAKKNSWYTVLDVSSYPLNYTGYNNLEFL